MKNDIQIIKLVHVLTPAIASRDSIRRLKEVISQLKVKTIELDFSNIEFISRSAAHELLKLQEEFSHQRLHNKNLVYKNLNNNVAQMISIVTENQEKIPEKPSTADIEEVDINFLSKSSI